MDETTRSIYGGRATIRPTVRYAAPPTLNTTVLCSGPACPPGSVLVDEDDYVCRVDATFLSATRISEEPGELVGRAALHAHSCCSRRKPVRQRVTGPRPHT